jgi:hypothetical protein
VAGGGSLRDCVRRHFSSEADIVPAAACFGSAEKVLWSVCWPLAWALGHPPAAGSIRQWRIGSLCSGLSPPIEAPIGRISKVEGSLLFESFRWLPSLWNLSWLAPWGSLPSASFTIALLSWQKIGSLNKIHAKPCFDSGFEKRCPRFAHPGVHMHAAFGYGGFRLRVSESDVDDRSSRASRAGEHHRNVKLIGFRSLFDHAN